MVAVVVCSRLYVCTIRNRLLACRMFFEWSGPGVIDIIVRSAYLQATGRFCIMFSSSVSCMCILGRAARASSLVLARSPRDDGG